MKLSLLQSYLLAEQLVDRDELQRVEAERVARGLTLPHALFALEVLDGEALVGFLARRFKLPRIDAGDLTAVDVGDRLDPAFVLQRRVLPIAREGDMLTLVMSDPTDSETAEEVERRTRTTVMRAVALEPALDAALARHYGGVQGEATGELRELFGEGMKVETQPLQHEEVIPLTRRKAPAPPLTPQNTDHLENLVTAPLPRIDFNPGQEPPPLPAEFQEPPPLPDLDDPPPLPASALLAPTPPVDAGAASGRQRRSSKVKKKTEPFPSLATGELVDEFEVSREIPATSRAPDIARKVDPQLPATLVDRLPEHAWSASQVQQWALDWLAQLAARTLLFRTDRTGRELHGWASAGRGMPAAPTLRLTMDERSLFGEVLTDGNVYVGPLPFGPTERRFAALVGRHPRELLLAPVADAEGTVGLVYCDDLHAAVRPRELAGFIQRLAEHLRRDSAGAP